MRQILHPLHWQVLPIGRVGQCRNYKQASKQTFCLDYTVQPLRTETGVTSTPTPSFICAVIAAEEALAAEVLGQCDSRDRFRDLFLRLYNYPKYGLPAQHGEPGGVLRCADHRTFLVSCYPI